MLHRPLVKRSGAWTPPIEQSLIFDGAAYLSRTPGSAGNLEKWSWMGWVRRSDFAATQILFGAGSVAGGGNFTGAAFESNNITLYWNSSSSFTASTAVFRDVGWYHFALVADTTTLTAYRNGIQVAQRAISGGAQVNAASVVHRIGEYPSGASGGTLKGAMADIHFLDGTALSQAQIQSTFLDGVVFDGQTLPAPKAVTGLTYGTNGFHLAFADSANFGDDTSGSGNDWTPTGFVAGDQTADVPGRPYAVWNAIWPSTGTISDGGRTTAGLGTSQLFMPSGKFYWEITATAASVVAGVVSTGGTATTTSVANGTTSGFRLDADAGTLDVTTDGVNYTSVGTGLTGGRFIRSSGGSNTINSGLTVFTYTPPTGFLPLHAGNLPTPSAPANPDTGNTTANGSADGPSVYLGYAPSVSDTLTLGGSAVTWGTHADRLSYGFKVRTASSPYNDGSGSKAYSLVTTNAQYGGGDAPWPLAQ